MAEIDDLVRRLAAVTDELRSLGAGDFEQRFSLEKERDDLRAQAAAFHERKDERRSVVELERELKSRRRQLELLQKTKINMTYQANHPGGGHQSAIGADRGGTLNNALMGAQGADSVIARIAELEQELEHALRQVRHPVAVLGADRKGPLPHAQAREAVHLPLVALALGLVRQEQDRLLREAAHSNDRDSANP